MPSSIWFIFGAFLNVITMGLVMQRSPKQIASQNWHTVVRHLGLDSDAIFFNGEADANVTQNDDCIRLFGARAWSPAQRNAEFDFAQIRLQTRRALSGGACFCPPSAPTFRYDTFVAKCVTKIDECVNPIAFRETSPASSAKLNSSTVIGIALPSINSTRDLPLLSNEFDIMWKDSAVKVRRGVGPRCTISGAKFLPGNGVWHAFDAARWLRLGWTAGGKSLEGNAAIFWNLSNAESTQNTTLSQLAGAILVIDFDCDARNTEKKIGSVIITHCLSFRVEGEIVNDESSSRITTPAVAADDFEGGIRAVKMAKNEGIVTSSASTNAVASATDQPPFIGASGGRMETMLIILLLILLFLSIFGSLMLWNICWRIKKSELISALQMQFLYHIRQEKEKAAKAAAADAQNRFRVMAAHANGASSPSAVELTKTGVLDTGSYASCYSASRGMMYTGGNRARDLDASVADFDGGGAATDFGVASGIVKRKLYFSAEFFEPYFMANPPPMAEQFLQDLRKMIALAKQRIAQRRHIQQLAAISEEESDAEEREESARSHVSMGSETAQMPGSPEKTRNFAASRFGRAPPPMPVANGSPRSANSASDDSGHDTYGGDASSSTSSSSSFSSSSTDDVESSSLEGGSSPAITPLLTRWTNGAKTVVSSPLKQQYFIPYNGISTTVHRQNPCYQPINGCPSPSSSRIPVSKSPRLQPKPFLTASMKVADEERARPATQQATAPSHAMANNYHRIMMLAQVAQNLKSPEDANRTNSSNVMRNRLPAAPNCAPNRTPPPLPNCAPPRAPSRVNEAKKTLATNTTDELGGHSQKRVVTGVASSSATQRNAYAVFPTSDSMLKKSLPRRSKRFQTPNSEPTCRLVGEARI